MKLITMKDGTQVSVFDEVRNRTRYFRCNRELREDEASYCQEQMGFHPCGYGFGFPKGKIVSKTWECSDSCD